MTTGTNARQPLHTDDHALVSHLHRQTITHWASARVLSAHTATDSHTVSTVSQSVSQSRRMYIDSGLPAQHRLAERHRRYSSAGNYGTSLRYYRSTSTCFWTAAGNEDYSAGSTQSADSTSMVQQPAQESDGWYQQQMAGDDSGTTFWLVLTVALPAFCCRNLRIFDLLSYSHSYLIKQL